jgi:formylglycine-generating enzyme required for sulfatase activity
VLIPDIQPSERTGFIQYIPGYEKPVAATICDDIVNSVFLKERPELMTHPCPLSSKYFLVSMKPNADGLWGIYLVDVFDNMTLIAELEGSGLFEPIPFQPRERPMEIPDKIKEGSATSSVFISDIYTGPGLKGIPRGTVKALRLFSYHYGYYGRAGIDWVATQGGWDIKRVLGTAKVEEDGSAHFSIPANTPVSIQPLDGEGRAVQLMRSWLVGMPGERVSCVGCHESRNQVNPVKSVFASQKEPEPLELWYGPARPFGFENEVYPVLQKHCIGCHSGKPRVGPRSMPSFANADISYKTLHPYVHRPGIEADMSLINPMEYHATTSPLIQLLMKGHHGVRLEQLDRESRERLYTWIDLNVQHFNGFEQGKPIIVSGNINSVERRRELAKEFACIFTDAEMEAKALAVPAAPVSYVAPPAEKPIQPDALVCEGFPMNLWEAETAQKAETSEITRTVSLGSGVRMILKRIPDGSFVMGSLDGYSDERPRAIVKIDHSFWMAETEVTNAQYACFDSDHDTRYIDMHFMDRVTPGYIANHPNQPVARVSWQEAMRFCDWMSKMTGLKVSLPTEAQWEWAARSGTETKFFYGSPDSDWSQYANLADQSLRWFDTNNYPGAGNLQYRNAYPSDNNFPLRDERFKDPYFVVDYVGMTKPNPWGLKDMIGNVSEWTKSSYKPYPYGESDGRNKEDLQIPKVARGGSWADRPADAGSSVRRSYESWQKVYDVGFRVIVSY